MLLNFVRHGWAVKKTFDTFKKKKKPCRCACAQAFGLRFCEILSYFVCEKLWKLPLSQAVSLFISLCVCPRTRVCIQTHYPVLAGEESLVSVGIDVLMYTV